MVKNPCFFNQMKNSSYEKNMKEYNLLNKYTIDAFLYKRKTFDWAIYTIRVVL